MSKLKNYCDIYTGNSISDSEKDKYTFVDGSIPYISTKDIDLHTNNIDYENGMFVKDDLNKFKIAPKNCTLLCIEGGSAGKKIGYLKQDVCFVNKLCCFANFKGNPRFLFYYLQSDNFVSEFNLNMTGLIGGVSQSIIKNMSVDIPNQDKQDKIVNYLDDKCSIINNIIENNDKEIELLSEFLINKITEISTSGLKCSKIKNSNIAWIGSIPENWEIRSFKNVMKERNEKNNPVISEERLSLSIDKGITTYSEKTTNLDRFKDDFTQYKLAHIGDLVFNSMNMIVGAVGYSNYFGCVSPIYYTYFDDEDKNHFTSRYYEYIFKTKTIKKILFSMGKGIISIDRGDDKINTCRLKISRDDLRQFKVPFPPYQERKDIVEYLDNLTVKINRIIEYRRKIIEKIEEYKKSLIYEVVTGKKEV